MVFLTAWSSAGSGSKGPGGGGGGAAAAAAGKNCCKKAIFGTDGRFYSIIMMVCIKDHSIRSCDTDIPVTRFGWGLAEELELDAPERSFFFPGSERLPSLKRRFRITRGVTTQVFHKFNNPDVPMHGRVDGHE